MAQDTQRDAKVSADQSPRLDSIQTTQACKVLLRHIADERKDLGGSSGKQNLLATDPDSGKEDTAGRHNNTLVWLIMTTKRHIVDKKRLKPNKIPVPHSLQASSTGSICLITADPQRLYKDAIAHPSFPNPQLRGRITRVIEISKLRTKYKSFESRRQLLAEHDVFLADSRIIIYLPGVLGKAFYKGGTKRPVPIEIGGLRDKDDNGKRVKAPPISVRKNMPRGDGNGAASPVKIAKEVQKALDSVLVHLAPGVSTAVKVANALFSPNMCAENIEAVVSGMAEKFITQGWRNIRAIHIKGPNTAAFPIWMARELWVSEEDVLEEKKVQGKKNKRALLHDKTLSGPDSSTRPSAADSATETPWVMSKRTADASVKSSVAKPAKKKRKAEPDVTLEAEINARKEKLKRQKATAMASVKDPIA